MPNNSEGVASTNVAVEQRKYEIKVNVIAVRPEIGKDGTRTDKIVETKEYQEVHPVDARTFVISVGDGKAATTAIEKLKKVCLKAGISPADLHFYSDKDRGHSHPHR